MTTDSNPSPKTDAFYTTELWEERTTAEERVIGLYLEGVTSPKLIAKHTNIPVNIVRVIISRGKLREKADHLKHALMKEVLEEKVPLLKEVVELSLTSVRDWLQELSANEERKESLTTAEICQIGSLAKNLNEMLRLELGKSTANVEVNTYSLQQTQVVLQQLKSDPVFGDMYAQLPDIEVKPEDAPAEATGGS